MKWLMKIQTNLVVVVPLVMLAGFIFGLNFEPMFLKSFIIPLTFLMVYPIMVTLPLSKLAERGDSKVQIITQLINFGVVPFLALGLGKLFFADNPAIIIGLLLAGLLPTSGMTISWTSMAGGNMGAAIKMTVIGLLLGSFLTPFYLKLLMGAEVAIPLGKIFFQIAVVVLLPLIFGNITQRLLISKFGKEKFQKKIKKQFPPFSMIGVIGVVFVALALKAESIYANPSNLLSLLIPLVLLYSINFLLSTIVGKLFLKPKDAIALVYGSVMRNLSIALAIALSVFGEKGADIALIVALAYIVQVQFAAWYQKLSHKFWNIEKK